MYFVIHSPSCRKGQIFEEKFMTTSFINIFRNLRGSYNLLDLAQKPRGKSLPKSRQVFKKQYEILNKYKQGKLKKIDAVNELTALKNINENEATDLINSIKENNIIPMRLK